MDTFRSGNGRYISRDINTGINIIRQVLAVFCRTQGTLRFCRFFRKEYWEYSFHMMKV